MLIHPQNLKHHVAAASRGRYALNSIALTEKGTLSTDGHALLFVPYPEENPADAPKIDGVDPRAKPPMVEPFLVSLPDAAKAAAMVGKGSRHAPPITRLLQAEVKGTACTFGATDLSNAQTMRVQRQEGAWPEVARVIPNYGKSLAISVDIDQLLRSVKALRGATDADVVTLRIIDDEQAIGMSCRDGTAMLCMPVQVEEPEDHVPCQLAKLREDCPAVATPAEPEDEEDEDQGAQPEVEMEVAQGVKDALPELPEQITQPASTPTTSVPSRRRKRRNNAYEPEELAEIIGR